MSDNAAQAALALIDETLFFRLRHPDMVHLVPPLSGPVDDEKMKAAIQHVIDLRGRNLISEDESRILFAGYGIPV